MFKFKEKLYNKLAIKNQNFKNGFSFIELLLSISIISIGLVGVAGLVVYNLSFSKLSSERLIATNLAQEGIEVVRNIRDSNWLEGNSFDSNISPGLSIPIFTGPGIQKNNDPSDVNKWELANIGGADWKKQVYYDNEIRTLINLKNQFHGQSKFQEVSSNFPDYWEKTLFTRWIEISYPSFDEIKVISIVEWTDRSGNQNTITLEEHLYDWKP